MSRNTPKNEPASVSKRSRPHVLLDAIYKPSEHTSRTDDDNSLTGIRHRHEYGWDMELRDRGTGERGTDMSFMSLVSLVSPLSVLLLWVCVFFYLFYLNSLPKCCTQVLGTSFWAGVFRAAQEHLWVWLWRGIRWGFMSNPIVWGALKAAMKGFDSLLRKNLALYVLPFNYFQKKICVMRHND